MITLASASLGLVAALAWDEAIKAFLKELLGADESIKALFIYAILATLIAVVVLVILARMESRIGAMQSSRERQKVRSSSPVPMFEMLSSAFQRWGK